MGQWSREELQEAHDHYGATAAEAASTGNWGLWADLFTEDAVYLEHHYGEFHGRDEIKRWIVATMGEWPNSQMTSFPHTWCVCDEERGGWVCRIENRFEDPGDGEIYQEHNITVLRYAGDHQWSYEEDAYNPANFGTTVKAWLDARKAAKATEPAVG
jgi:SnoaL-like domain